MPGKTQYRQNRLKEKPVKYLEMEEMHYISVRHHLYVKYIEKNQSKHLDNDKSSIQVDNDTPRPKDSGK